MTEENKAKGVGFFFYPGAESAERIQVHSSATEMDVRELKEVISVNRNLMKHQNSLKVEE